MKNIRTSNLKSTLLILTLFVFAMSCQNEATKTDAPAEASSKKEVLPTSPVAPVSTESAPESEEVADNEPKVILYAWVANLNIRDAPNLVGNTIARVASKDALVFTGEQSEQKEEIVLRGLVYEAHWLKIITPDKKEGWVFGGAVREKGEQKGTAPLTDKRFSFPHFGTFDLSTWKNLGTQIGGDEVDYSTTTYQKRNEILEVKSSSIGEFHYGYDYKLMDGEKKVLKTRKFSFAADADGSGKITETVTDFMSKTVYTRFQNLRTHFYQLNAKPKMVNGIWVESALAADTELVPTTAPEVEEN